MGSGYAEAWDRVADGWNASQLVLNPQSDPILANPGLLCAASSGSEFRSRNDVVQVAEHAIWDEDWEKEEKRRNENSKHQMLWISNMA